MNVLHLLGLCVCVVCTFTTQISGRVRTEPEHHEYNRKCEIIWVVGNEEQIANHKSRIMLVDVSMIS